MNRIVIGLEFFQSQCTTPLKQATYAPYSDVKSWELWYFTEVPHCPQIQASNVMWVQKGTHV